MNDKVTSMLPAITKSTQTESSSSKRQRKTFGMTNREVINCCSVFLLPFMLGIFTVVITFYQSDLARQQRLEDQQVARDQREQDLNISRAQREQDLYIAKAQREEDVHRRIQDSNATQMQRDNDLYTAQLKRELDERLADLQRNLSEKQRAHELMIEANRYDQELEKYRHGILTAYMNEIEALIIKSNGTITSDARMAAIVRGKTLALIRQLDTTLKAHLIRFLYETGQLTTGQQPLDLTDAELDGIDLSSTTSDIQSMHGLTLANVYLRNASFVRRDLTNGNFSGARLSNGHFSESVASFVDFSGASLTNASFTDAILINASFVGSNGTGTRFDRVNATDGNFSRVAFQSSSFVQSSLHRTNFIEANLSATNFSLSALNTTLFMHSWLERANFDATKGKGVQFSYAILDRASFQHADLRTSAFVNVHAIETNFAFSNMHFANFTKAYAHRANFTNAILSLASFTDAWMNASTFLNATLSMGRLSFFDADFSNFSNVTADYSNFSYAKLFLTDFSNAFLKGVEFRRAQAGNINLSFSQAQHAIFTESYLEFASFAYADVEKAVFTNANLRRTKFMYSNIDITQLRQAIAIFGARLPWSSNTTVTRESNLIKNGGANCNISVSKNWQVNNGVVGLEYHNSTDCYFTPLSANGTVTMSQQIDVKRYIDKVHDPRAEDSPDGIILTARMGGGTVVRVVGKPINVQFSSTSEDIQNGTLKYRWYPKKTKELEVVVEFGSMNQSAWCDEIDLWIQVAQHFALLHD